MRPEFYYTRWQDVAKLLLNRAPSIEMIRDWEDDDGQGLQDFCAVHAKLQWMTGIDIIESIYSILEGAIGNANLSQDCKVEFPSYY